MHYDKQQIADWDRVLRLKVINSVTGIKPANLIGTISKGGTTNLAVFSSVVHLGSNPALLGFVARPSTDEVGHTFQNILETSVYTVNHIHPDFTKNAHYTSAKFDKSTSEFEACNLSEDYIEGFDAPFVGESHFKMGLSFVEAVDLPNGTKLIIGEVEHVILPEKALSDGDIDLEQTKSVGISGLNTYYKLEKVAQYPFVRIGDVPKF